MTHSATLDARLQFLDDTLRKRFPGFIDGSTDVASETQPDPHRLPAHARLEQAIGKIVATRIPSHPAYNTLVLNTLKAYRTNNIAALNSVADRARLLSIINEAHKMRPVFPLSYHRDDFLHLHTLLNDYSKIEGGSLRQFPSIETLGYRRDLAGLRKSDHGQTVERARGMVNLRYAADEIREQNIPLPEGDGPPEDSGRAPTDVWVDKPEGWIRNLPLRRKQLKAINRFIDTLCPPGSYFNGMRMQLIHRVWSNRHFFEDYKSTLELNESKGWGTPGYGVKNGRIVEEQFVWMPEDKWQPMKKFIDGMNKMLEDTRNRLKTSAGRYPQPMTPQEAVTVDRLVRQHAQLSELHAERHAKTSAPPPGHIPEGVRRAVTRAHNPVTTNPIARQWAEKCAETIEQIVPFRNRKTLDRRLELRDLVYSSRDALLKSNTGTLATSLDRADVSDVSGAEDNRGRIYPLTVADLGDPMRSDESTQKRFSKLMQAGKIRYAEPMSRKYEWLTRNHFNKFSLDRGLFEQLARELNSFDDAWTGKLRKPPPERVAPRVANPPSAKLRKPASAFQTNELIGAAKELGQTKLPLRTLSGRPLSPPKAVPFVPPRIEGAPFEGGELEPALRPAKHWDELCRGWGGATPGTNHMRYDDGDEQKSADWREASSPREISPEAEELYSAGSSKRKRGSDGSILDDAASQGASSTGENTPPDIDQAPAKRARLEDHLRNRSRSHSRG